MFKSLCSFIIAWLTPLPPTLRLRHWPLVDGSAAAATVGAAAEGVAVVAACLLALLGWLSACVCASVRACVVACLGVYTCACVRACFASLPVPLRA